MSTNAVRLEIARFLATPDPEVLCLQGKWGVGKTFAWQRYVEDTQAADGVALERYAFVSLFGVNSIEQLRLAIVENTVPRERIGKPIDLQSVLKDPLQSAQGNWRRLLGTIGMYPA